MTFLLLSLLLAALLLYAVVLLKTYRNVSAKELKRQARDGDKLAEALYKVVGYGASLDIVLWFVIGISGGLLFVVFADSMPFWLSVFGIASIIWFGFAWLPNTHGTQFGNTLAKYTAGPLHGIINFLYPILSRIERLIGKYRPVTVHTGIYTKDDLIELLKQQKGQLDNRIAKEDILIAQNSLNFGEKFVRDVMTPRRVMSTVSIDENISPVVMEELHKTGHSRFPVYEGKKDNFTGILYMRDMLKKRTGGKVKDLMEKKVYYVHDEDLLTDVLQVFIKTHHHLFLVVNTFEEVVGLISMEDILEQIVGKPIIDEFDQYDDLRAVAAKQAEKEQKNHNHPLKKSS
ncbi:CBS domain-containing protein [Candidatus Saccharibacteria bacterium]|nr:CBS domain-containing protein [Candidatus Saccharibacteria bacterium]